MPQPWSMHQHPSHWQSELSDKLQHATSARVDMYDDGTVAVEIGYRSYIEATPVGVHTWDLAIRGYAAHNGVDYEREVADSLTMDGVVRRITDMVRQAGEEGW